MRTYKERLVAGLRAKGYKPVAQLSGRYEAFADADLERKVFVGVSGALRVGRTATSSYSIGDPQRQTETYKALLSAGDRALGPATTAEAVEVLMKD